MRCSMLVVVLFLSLSVASDFGQKIIVGFIGLRERIPFAELVLHQAEKQLKADGYLPTDLAFEYVFKVGCDVAVDILRISKDLFEVNNADVIIGPECTAGMNVAALVASAFDRPIFGYASVDDRLSDKQTFATLVRVSKSMGSLGAATRAMLNYFSWKDIGVVHTASSDCQIGLSGILNDLTKSSINVRGEITTSTSDDIDRALSTVKTVARILLLCYGWGPDTANEFLLKAFQHHMDTPDYVYIIPYYVTASSDQVLPWQNDRLNETTRSVLQEMYKNVLVIQATSDSPQIMGDFRAYMENATSSFNATAATAAGMETLLPIMFDTMYLYGMALNHTANNNGNITSGVAIREACKFVAFTGRSGKIFMNKFGDRVSEYYIYSMNGTNLTPLVKIPVELVKQNDTIIRVPLELRAETFDTPDGRHPPDTPPCGFVNTCLIRNAKNSVIIGTVVAFSIGIIAISIFAYYRKWKFERSLIKMSWKLALADVKLLTPSNGCKSSTYLWAAVCLFICGVARRISGLLLYGIIGMVFDTWVAIVSAFIVFPAFLFMQLRKVRMSETEREQLVLFGSVIEGVLVGALLGGRYILIFTPPLFILPLAMGLVSFVAGSKEQLLGNRRAFLGALLGGAGIGYLVFGFLFNFSFSYIIAVVLLTGAAAADLQLKLVSIQRGDSSPQLEQWKTIVILSIAGTIGRHLASSKEPPSGSGAEEKKAK